MRHALLSAAAMSVGLASTAWAQDDLTVGVSWSNFQEERWKTDEAAIKSALDEAGAEYVSADAQSSSAKQLSDIESLIAQGVDALIILAQDAQAIGPAIQQAADEGIPVVGYDRLIEDPRAFYLTFDNIEVGRMQARAVLEEAPEGNYVMIKGSPTDPERRLPARRPAGGPAGGDRQRRDHHRRRGLHRRLAAGQRAAEHGADPDRERQQGRRGRGLQRRHRGRRRGGAHRAGHGRHPGLGAGRRPRRAEPHRAGHPDRSASGRTRATSAARPARSPSRWRRAPR